MKVKIIESKRDTYILCLNGEKQLFSTSDILKDKAYDVIEISKHMYRNQFDITVAFFVKIVV